MDKRSWPWKKKSSDKQVVERAIAEAFASDSHAAASDISAKQVNKGKKDNSNEKPKYVQISVESYKHLTGLEDQVKSYEEQVQRLEDEVNELNEKLSEAHSEMTDKDNLVKQHAKVAEEAVSGWEKAEAEAATLKNQVESVTLLKLTAEDRASHLDGALKECMRQIQNLKEDYDQKLHELALNKTKLFDKMKLELESQISNLEQDLLRSAAENAALSRSLQDRSNTLIKLSEEKSQAEAEIRFLTSNVEACEKEVNSLKYELHVARKEVEIRNEEKNMSVRSLEVANKHHVEGVKKIAKLEAECQRLRGLVRKKLPGPAALAQMKLEVENLGRDYGEPRLRRSPRSLDNALKYQKENELLTERLLAMDEQIRILNEALENRESEFQASRSVYAHTASKIRCLEAQVRANADARVPIECLSNKKDSDHLRFVSEDGNDDNASCAGSCTTVSISEKSYIQKEKNADGPPKPKNTNRLDLMDDFLEMEKLAHVSHGSSGAISCSEVSNNTGNNQELEIAISRIYDFLMILSKEAKAVDQGTSDEDGLIKKLNTFSAKYTDAINSKINLVDFILDISCILSKSTSLHLGLKSSEVETSSSFDCIDKIALPENKAVVESSSPSYPNDCCSNSSHSASDPDIPSDGNLVPTSESMANSRKCSLEEFEQLKMDKDNLAVDFESTKSQLVETEQLLADVRSQLKLAQKSNSLAETQLKCMAESYRALETRADELQTEVNLLQAEMENLENELNEERKSHQDALTRCDDLLDQLQRIDSCAAADNEKTSQEKELTAAAEKLAECQETIFLLDKQLKALRPQTNVLNSPNNVTSQNEEVSLEGEISEMDIYDSFNPHRKGSEPTLNHLLNGPPSPSESEANRPLASPVGSKLPKHQPTKSGSSSASSTPTPEKQNRGFSRFFSSKGKSGYIIV